MDREARRAYEREWYRKNRERILERLRGKRNDYYKKRYEEFRETILAKQAEYRRQPGKMEEIARRTAAWRASHPEYREQWPEKYGTAYTRAWRQRNPEKMRRYYKAGTLKKYGLTIEQFEAMVEAQDNLCAICRQPETQAYKGQTNTLSVDHHHASGQVRGLLCANCNIVVGHARDDIAILKAIIAYLERYGHVNLYSAVR